MAFRKYPSFRQTPHRAAQLLSQGAPSGTQQTVVPRRRRQLGLTPNAVQSLPGYGPTVSGSSSGTLSATVGAVTASGTGTVLVQGTLSKTLGAVSLVATSVGQITGTLSVTLGAVTTAAASVPFSQYALRGSNVETIAFRGSYTRTIPFTGSVE